MKSISTVGSLVGAAALAVFLAGCDNTQEGLKRDAEENQRNAEAATADARQKASEANEKAGQSVKDATENVGQAVENAAKTAGHAVGDVAATTGKAVGDAVATTGRTIDAATQTADVKTALIADKTVDASNINVDTDQPRTVVLKGHVPTDAERAGREDCRSEGGRLQDQNSARSQAVVFFVYVVSDFRRTSGIRLKPDTTSAETAAYENRLSSADGPYKAGTGAPSSRRYTVICPR